MNDRTWGYSTPVGEWTAVVSVPQAVREQTLEPLRHVLRLLTPAVSSLHRLRKMTVSWAEYDAAGNELSFHELEDVEATEWGSMEDSLQRVLISAHRVAVSSLFLELDTRVVSESSGPNESWADRSAELQISFVAPELSPPEAGVIYSTSIDVWLPVTYDASFAPRDNAPLSRANHPRLEEFLASLEAMSSTGLRVGQSKLYAEQLSALGFVSRQP